MLKGNTYPFITDQLPRGWSDFNELWNYSDDATLELSRRQDVMLSLTRFYVNLQRGAKRSYGTGPRAQAIHLAAERLEADFEVRKNLPDMASELGLDYRVLRREFKRATGLSMGDYRIQHRLKLAREFLKEHSVGEVANKLGYKDPFTFSAQFKRFLGLSPLLYQKQTFLN